MFRPIKHGSVGVRVLERWAERHGQLALLSIGEKGERGYPFAAREDAVKAAHWFFKAHPDHKQIREELI